MRPIFFLNPKAGNSTDTTIHAWIEQHCNDQKVEYKIVVLNHHFTAEDINQEIDDFQATHVIAGGGDGTFNYLASSVLGKGLPIGTLPMGSANSIAHNFSIPNRLEDAIATALRAKTCKLNVLTVNGKYCFHVCDLGLNASIVKKSQSSKVKGMYKYAKHFLSELLRLRQFKYILYIDGLEYSGKAVSLVCTNTQLYGSGANINPQGERADGLFEIVIVKPFRFSHVFRMLIRLFRGSFHLDPRTLTYRAEEAKLINKSMAYMHIDGELQDKVKEVDLKNLKDKLQVICG